MFRNEMLYFTAFDSRKTLPCIHDFNCTRSISVPCAELLMIRSLDSILQLTVTVNIELRSDCSSEVNSEPQSEYTTGDDVSNCKLSQVLQSHEPPQVQTNIHRRSSGGGSRYFLPREESLQESSDSQEWQEN